MHPQSTQRLHFSQWRATDLDNATLLWGDPRVTALIAKDAFTPAQIKSRLELEITSQTQDGVQHWPMFTADGELIGVCGLHSSGPDEYELGYHLRPEFWHQGIATETVRQVIEFAKTRLHALRLLAGHTPRNLASKHVLEKLGFVYTHDVFYAAMGVEEPNYELKLHA
ncbi:MAG: GNAT family N-acetyltransferase [Lacticaseibacillus songhuajiangensis]|jgi:RimJ/RimL family protein N-acetyltransferase|nr:GNAT family N-acetyltransferase [Lacticaseibacillus songhuajiangensis]